MILRVPYKYLLSLKHANVKKVCDKYGIEKDRDFLCLVVFLIKEKRKENTPFKAWLESLPKSFAEHPLMIKEKDLHILNNTMALEQIHTMKKDMNDTIQYLRKKITDIDISDRELKLTYLQVYTRIFNEKQSDLPTMSPYADLFNTHIDEKINIDWKFDNKTGDELLFAKKKIKKREELFDHYLHEWSNTGFFNLWGLTLNQTSKHFDHVANLFIDIGNKTCNFTLRYPAIPLKARNENINSCLQVGKTKRINILKLILKNLKIRYTKFNTDAEVNINLKHQLE
jgi:hypothetical protein